MPLRVLPKAHLSEALVIRQNQKKKNNKKKTPFHMPNYLTLGTN